MNTEAFKIIKINQIMFGNSCQLAAMQSANASRAALGQVGFYSTQEFMKLAKDTNDAVNAILALEENNQTSGKEIGD